MKPSPKEAKAARDYQAQDDLRTLRNAAEVRKDSKRFKAAQKELEKQAAAIDKASKIFPRGKAGKRS